MRNDNQQKPKGEGISLSQEEINELMNVISNKEKMSKLLNSKEAKEIISKLGGNKNG